MATYIIREARDRRYGFWNFMLDILMLALTGGLWFIWILIREIRRSR